VSGRRRDDGDDDDDDEPSDDTDASEFRRALDGVKPLDRRGLRPEPPPRLRPAPKRGAAPEEPVAFAIERAGERVDGLAPGVDRRRLAELRRGTPAPDRRLDLHGLDAAGAERGLRRELARALEAGERCLLVIHGRGRRSEGAPVLKTSLPGWLSAPPHGRRILAFATAPPALGGAGATLVLLRRPRAAKP